MGGLEIGAIMDCDGYDAMIESHNQVTADAFGAKMWAS
jgi:hypothetical protein